MRGAVSIAVFSAALAALGAEPKAARLTGFDVLTLPGQQVLLRAKLEHGGWPHGDVHGEQIEFRLIDGRVLGVATTGKDGIAALPFRPAAIGHYHVAVALPPDSAYQAPPDTLLVAAWPADARILVTDLDHTLADITAMDFLGRDNKDIPTLPGAPEALKELSASYRIIYLTARDDAFTRKTRSWLTMNGFPDGPVFTWDFLGAPLSHAKFKELMIAEWKKSFPRIEVGVGDLEGDARAYLRNGLKAFIIAPGKPDDDLPKEAIVLKSWSEIVEQLAEKDPR